MKKKIRKELHRETVLDTASVLKDVDYCVFYGSALGIHRDGDMIDGDDDVDVLINREEYERVDSLLKEAGFRSSEEINGQKVFPGIFSQYYKIRDSEACLLDVYFYHDIHEDFIIDKWNGYGKPNNKETYLIIPKKMVFEHNEVDFFGHTIKMPADPEAMCRYMYGNRYKEPLVKNVDYRQVIINNRFVIEYFKKY